jgi:hypothetical protein
VLSLRGATDARIEVGRRLEEEGRRCGRLKEADRPWAVARLCFDVLPSLKLQ